MTWSRVHNKLRQKNCKRNFLMHCYKQLTQIKLINVTNRKHKYTFTQDLFLNGSVDIYL